jgi:hypothetical protein
MNRALNLIDRWASGDWDNEVWSWVIGIVAVASLLTFISELN